MPEKHLTTLCTLLGQPPLPNDVSAALMNYSQEDWEGLLDLASKHSLFPLLYARLKSLGISHTIPEIYDQKMCQAVLTNATRNAIFLHEAGILLNALKKAQIPIIGLKGVYLLENIYPDISSRSMNDLDLMVKKQDIPTAIAICQSLGYQPTTYFNIHDTNLDIKHVPPLKKEPGPYLELHWTILEEDEPFTIDATGLWERALPAKIAGVDALALSLEDLVLHLSLHLAYQHHLKLGLRGLYDVAVTLRHFQEQLNWEKLVEIAHTWGATRVLELTLTLAEDLLGAPIPSEIWAQVRSDTFEPWVIEESRRQLLKREHATAVITPDLAKFAQEGGVFKRTQQIWRRIFLPKVTLARLYNVPPTSLRFYGCYFRRLGDLIKAYAPTVKRIFMEDEAVFTDVKIEQSIKDLRSWMIKE